MAVSSIGASVSAIKTYDRGALSSNQKTDLKNAVDSLNKTLKSSTDIIDKSIDLTKNRVVKAKELKKIVTIMSILEQIKTQMTKWDDFSIENINLVNETNDKIKNLNLKQILEDLKDTNKLDSVKDDLNKTSKVIEEIDKRLEIENQRLLSQENDNNFNLLNSYYQINVSVDDNNKDFNLINNNYDTFCLLDDNKQKEKSDADLAKKIKQIHNSDEPTDQKIKEIINILENKKFNDYNRQLNIILPIVDSLHIAGDANANIVENKNLRNQLKKFLLQSVEEKINEKIKVYNENEITKPMANYINNVKSDIAESSVNTVITATFHGKYVNAEQLFDIVNMNLSLCEEDFKNSANDKNMVKGIDNLSFVKLLDNISNEKYTFDSKKESEKFDIMFRQYAKRITGMKTNLEKEAGYGENNGEDISDDELIGLQEAINKWGIGNLEQHYIRDKVTKDNLDDVLQKYKSLNDFKTKIDAAISARVDKDYQIGNPEDNEKELKEAIDQARKAIEDFQNHVVVIDNSEFLVLED